MKGWQNRVVAEQAQLQKRIGKLDEFIGGEEFKDLDMQDRWGLEDQHDHMRKYSLSLRNRIGRF